MNTYKSYLQDKDSYFHQTEKKILNLLKSSDLKNRNKFLSSKVKNRLIDSLIYMHQFKPNCKIRKNFRKKYNLNMHGGKKEMITLQDIIAPTGPKHNHSDLEKQFQEITTKIFQNQKEYIYPDGDQKLFLQQPQYELMYKVDKQGQEKKLKKEKNDTILELLRKSGKNSTERINILNEINKNQKTKSELTEYLTNQGVNQNSINLIIKIKEKILEKYEIKKDLDQINQLTDIINESKTRTTRNFIETSNQDINNNLMRKNMDNTNSLIFNSIVDYNLEFVNMKTETNQKCKYQLKDENTQKNNLIRKKYKEYKKYDELIPILETKRIKDPNNKNKYIYDIEQLGALITSGDILPDQHITLYEKIVEYNNYKNGNVTILSSDLIKKINNSLLGLQLLYEINDINLNVTNKPTELEFLKNKLYSPGIKYSKINNLIQHITALGRNANINDNTTQDLLSLNEYKDDIFIELDTSNAFINNTLQSYGIYFLVGDNLHNYYLNNITAPPVDIILGTLQTIIDIYSYLIKNNNSEVNLDNIRSGINQVILEIKNKEQLLNEITDFDTICKYNTQCGVDNLCHLKKCIYEVLASSGKLKGQHFTGLEIRNTVEQKFKKMYPEYEKENFINECKWLDGKVINFLENEYNVRIILINKFDYNFNQELIEYNEFKNNKINNKKKNKKGTLEDIDEITNINNSIKNMGINYINKNSMSNALQKKFSTKNTQGSILCQNLKIESQKNYSKIVFIIYNTDDYYQLLKINNKTQLSLSDIPYELKNFVNNSCNTKNPILKISNEELINNRVDYKLLEEKILNYLYKNQLSNTSDKKNYFRNLIRLYTEQDKLLEINNKLNGLSFKIENNYLISDLDERIDLRDFNFLKLKVKRNADDVGILGPDYNNMKNVFNLGEINNEYLVFSKISKYNQEMNKLKINLDGKLNSIVFKQFYENDFKVNIINQNLSIEFLFKLFDFICYLNREPNDYYLVDLENLSLKNDYIKIILDNLEDSEEFLKAFKVYKYLELEKVNNSKIYSQNSKASLFYKVKPQELFNNIIPLNIRDISGDIDKTRYIQTTKLFQIYNNPTENAAVITMMDNLTLEYQYLFSIFIRDFFLA